MFTTILHGDMEMLQLIFKSKQKKFESDLKMKLCSERLYLAENVKHIPE